MPLAIYLVKQYFRTLRTFELCFAVMIFGVFDEVVDVREPLAAGLAHRNALAVFRRWLLRFSEEK